MGDTREPSGEGISRALKTHPSRRLFPWRLLLWTILAIAACMAVAYAATALRACESRLEAAFKTETIERIYEYGASVARDSRIILATRSSSFVIPREIVRKIILGLSSTATVQISCQAEILWALPAQALFAAVPAWSGRDLHLTLDPPEPLRPIIETASIRKAVLDRGFLINEAAQLDILLGELSDLVAASAGAEPDEAILETCRTSLEDLCRAALAADGKAATVRVSWRAP